MWRFVAVGLLIIGPDTRELAFFARLSEKLDQVGPFLDRLAELHALLDPVEAGRDHRREGQVRV